MPWDWLPRASLALMPLHFGPLEFIGLAANHRLRKSGLLRTCIRLSVSRTVHP